MNAYHAKTNRRMKVFTRRMVCREFLHVSGGMAAKKALFLPSLEMADVKEAQRQGAVNSSSKKLVFVEKDADIVKIIDNKAENELGIPRENFRTYHGNFESKFNDFNLNEMVAPFYRSDGRNPFDLAYFDSCGEIDRKMYEWLSEYRDHLNSVKLLAFTFSIGHRNNHFFSNLDDNTSVGYHQSGATHIRGNITEKNEADASWVIGAVCCALGRIKACNSRKVRKVVIYKENGHSTPMVTFTLGEYRDNKPRAKENGTAFIDQFFGWEKSRIELFIKENGHKMRPTDKAWTTRLIASL